MMENGPDFPELDLDPAPLQFEQKGETWFVLDLIRKRWLSLNPEEWVRQHVLNWMIRRLLIPENLISVERKVGSQTGKRFDVLAYSQEGKPLLLIECKAFDVQLDMRTIRQVTEYNQHLGAGYIWITNGLQHGFLQIEDGKARPISRLPTFSEMHQNRI